jgi:hypothetical protein
MMTTDKPKNGVCEDRPSRYMTGVYLILYASHGDENSGELGKVASQAPHPLRVNV